MIEYDPPVPRIGFAVAAALTSMLTFSLMVALPSALEEESSTLALRGEPHRTAANPPAADTLDLRCAIAAAVNTPLFAGAPASAAGPKCRQPS
ncbi:MAG TPA: hypothetical protein VMU96_12370 [Casimicrobiaceae bacterium]|nr:hypothetical protein [Casimicrobiaceae bacterium]